MSVILCNLPFSVAVDEVSCGLERVPIKPYQIIAWVSLTTPEILELPPHASRFPAVVDTGHNHNFSIKDKHLAEWAKVAKSALPRLRRIRERGRYSSLHAANLWLHPNRRGTRDEFSGAPAFRLLVDQGIIVNPGEEDFPRLPLLGLRALVRNKLYFTMDPECCTVDLRTADWRTKLLRWLS